MAILAESVSRCRLGARMGELTVPVSTVARRSPRASQAMMVEMSWTSRFVSAALVDEERSWLSFARRHGWLEIWTPSGCGVAMTEASNLDRQQSKVG